MQDQPFAQNTLSETAMNHSPSNPTDTSSMSNNPQDIEVIVQKITKIQQAQAEVITLMHALNRVAMVVETDLEGNIIYVNDLFCAVSKYPAHELLNQNHNLLRSGHQSEVIYAELWQTIQNAKVWSGFLKNKTKDGQFYWVELTIFPQVNSQGQILKYVAVSFDVTQLIEHGDDIDFQLLGPYIKNNAGANQQYQQLTQKLRQAHDEVMNLNRLLSHTVAITETDLEGIIVQANEKYLQLMGYQAGDLEQRNIFLVQPEQMPKQFYHDLWKTIQSGSIWRGMFSVSPKNGNELWLDTTIIPEFNAEGKVHKYFAISIDVTVQEQVIQEHKATLETLQHQSTLLNAEVEHLRKANSELEKLQLLLYHQVSALNAAALLMEVDILGKVIFVNDFFAEKLKHAKNALLGQQYDQLSFEVMAPHTYDDLWQSINMGQVWKGQIAYLDADEKPFWVQTIIYPIANEVEELVKFIIIHYDISYEHQRIAQLTNQNLELIQTNEKLSENITNTQQEFHQTLSEYRNQVPLLSAFSQVMAWAQLDAKGKIIDANSNFIHSASSSYEELLQQSYLSHVADHNDPILIQTILEKINSQTAFETILFKAGTNGEKFAVQMQLVPSPALEKNESPLLFVFEQPINSAANPESTNLSDSNLVAEIDLLQADIRQLKEREKEYQYLIQDHESLLAEYPNRIADLNSEIERMRIDYLNLQELKAERDSYSQDVEWGLNQTISGLREEIHIWSIKYDEIRMTNEALHERIKEWQSKAHAVDIHSTILEDNQRLEEKLANLSRELATKQEQIAEMEHQLASGKDENSNSVLQIEQKQSEQLNLELAELKEQLTALQGLRASNTQLQQHIVELEAQLNELHMAKAELENKIKALQQTPSTETPSSDWLKNELSSLRQELKDLINNGPAIALPSPVLDISTELDSEKAKLQQDVVTLNTKIDTLEHRIKELEEETELYRREIELQRNNFVDARHDWNAQLNRLEAQLFEYQQLVEESNRNLANFQEKERLWLIEEERLKSVIVQLQSGVVHLESYPESIVPAYPISETPIGSYAGTMLYNVLVIDYDSSLQNFVKERYVDSEITFYTTNDISKAIQLYKEVQPNLILIEHKLPFINGYHLLDAIRSLYNDKDTKIVAMLSKSLAQQASTYVANGFNSVIDTSNWPPTLRQYFLAGY